MYSVLKINHQPEHASRLDCSILIYLSRASQVQGAALILVQHRKQLGGKARLFMVQIIEELADADKACTDCSLAARRARLVGTRAVFIDFGKLGMQFECVRCGNCE